MTRPRESVTLDLDGQSVEVATGFGGVGVFLTVIGARKNRIITVALPRGRADELARLLRMAAEASRFNQELRASSVDDRQASPATAKRQVIPQPCMDDLRCCRNDGHGGNHLYPTPAAQ